MKNLMQVLIIKPSGIGTFKYKTLNIPGPDNKGSYTEHMAEMRKLIECDYIEHFAIKAHNSDNRYDLWFDEEGKLKGLFMFSYPLFDHDRKEPFDAVAGNVIITKSNEEGDTIGLTDEEVKEVLEDCKYCWDLILKPRKLTADFVEEK